MSKLEEPHFSTILYRKTLSMHRIMPMIDWIRRIVRFGIVMSAVGLAALVLAGNSAIPQVLQETIRPMKRAISEVSQPVCSSSVTYRIGSVDERFGLTREEFLLAMRQSAVLWNDSASQSLMEYSETGDIPVSLVYDERQAETEKLRGILDAIHSDEGKYAEVKKQYDVILGTLKRKRAEYESAGERYDAERKKLDRMVEEYGADLEKYNDRVGDWNTGGAVSGEEYDKLEKERKKLESDEESIRKKQKSSQKEYERLEEERKLINDMAARANALVSVLNGLAAKMNIRAEAYNGNGQTRESFEAGVYREQGDERSIDIYQFFDEDDLRLTLAHEFGHALGFGHVDEQSAVMHYKLGGQSFELTPVDRALVAARCAMNQN